MAVKQKGLGKGLGDLGIQALLSQVNTSVEQAPVMQDGQRLQMVPIEYCQPSPYQPRRSIAPEALEDLAASIRSQGLINPLVVRETAPKQYEIIAGERRWRAAQQAGLGDVPVLVKTMSDEAAMAVALVDNIQREDLNVMEQAFSLQKLIDTFGLTHEALAKTIGRSRAMVSNSLRLLKLPAGVQTLVENGDLDMGHARALLALPVSKQEDAAREVAAKALSVRETERLVAMMLRPKKETMAQPSKDHDTQRLEQALSAHFGTQVHIQASGAKGKGKLVLHYHSLDALSGLLDKCQFKDR